MEETNAWQAVRNNAYGTYVLARAAVAAKVEKFVLVSTDKAVNPDQRDGRDQAPGRDGVPGPAGRRARSSCSCASATCSAAPAASSRAFASRSRAAVPVTVTHPEITRYFMSLSEATQLLLQAGLQGRGGEILVLDMGEPVRIVDLARDMIKLSGADPAQHRGRVHGPAARREALRRAARDRGGDASPRRIPSCASRRRATPTCSPSGRWSRGARAIARPTTPRCARA